MGLELICNKCSHLMIRGDSEFYNYVRFTCKVCNIVIDSPNLRYLEQTTLTQDGKT